jgi:hypothetical protein
MEAHYEEVNASWEDRFEKIYGRWRGFVDHAVWRYLDCGIEEAGFARLKCCDCGRERQNVMLLTAHKVVQPGLPLPRRMNRLLIYGLRSKNCNALS